jgi:hypothetical protein
VRLSRILAIVWFVYLAMISFVLGIVGTMYPGASATPLEYASIGPILGLPPLIVVLEARRWLMGRRNPEPSKAPPALAPAPAPPPGTVMVKCGFCGTEQLWSYECHNCGNPMPRPPSGAS